MADKTCPDCKVTINYDAPPSVSLCSKHAVVDELIKGLKLIAAHDGFTNLDPDSINDEDYGRGAAYAYGVCAAEANRVLALVETKER